MYFIVPTGAFRSVILAICLFICCDLISPAVTADRLTTSQIILKFYLWNKAIVIHYQRVVQLMEYIQDWRESGSIIGIFNPVIF